MNKDKIKLIIQMKIDSLNEELTTGLNQEAKLGRDYADKVEDGTITTQDLIDAQDHGIKAGDLLIAFTHLRKNAAGMTEAESIELGHKIQFIYLSYHQAQGRTDGMSLFRESMRPHEEGIDAIYAGTYDPVKLEVLKSLPEVSAWDHKLGAAAYSKIF